MDGSSTRDARMRASCIPDAHSPVASWWSFPSDLAIVRSFGIGTPSVPSGFMPKRAIPAMFRSFFMALSSETTLDASIPRCTNGMIITSQAKYNLMAGFLEAFVLLLGIMDPLLSLAAFLTLTKNMDREERDKIAIKAVIVAAVVFFIFAIGGGPILGILGVQMDSFKAAGGIVLILLGIQMSLGITFPKEKDDMSEVAVVIGTPMITGPATISAAIILGASDGVITTVVAGSAALLVTLLALVFARHLDKIFGTSGIRIMSTMMGIITMAWGLQFLLIGISSFKP